MRTFARLLLVAAVAAPVLALAPAATAGNCDSDTVIFSSSSALFGIAVNSNALVCFAADTSPTYDSRIINPGSDTLMVRYTLPAGTAYLTATLTGLGFAGEVVTLERTVFATGDVVYDSADLAIDPAASGAVCADVHTPTGALLDTVCYHTIR